MRLQDIVQPENEDEMCSNAVNHIRSRMIERGLTQTALAEKMSQYGSEVSSSQVSRILSGKNSLTLERVFQMLKALETSPNDMFGFFPELDWEDIKEDATNLVQKMTLEQFNVWVRQGWDLVDEVQPEIQEEEIVQLDEHLARTLEEIQLSLLKIKLGKHN